jgi:hypothetical protein
MSVTIWHLNGQENFEQMDHVSDHTSESNKIACSVYVDGMDWYRTPCYRYFEGNKPKFLASILYKHETKIMKDFQTSIVNIKLVAPPISFCGSCRSYNNPCCTNTNCINNPKKVEIPKPEEFASKKLIAKIIDECENSKATNNYESARAACVFKPHMKFVIDNASIKCIACHNNEGEGHETSISNFVAWCMFDNDDCADSKKLDGIMVRYKYYKSVYDRLERRKSCDDKLEDENVSDDDYSEMIEV